VRYRWEYRLTEQYTREWFLYSDAVCETVVVASRIQAEQLIGAGHPLLAVLAEFYGTLRWEPLEIRPYEPVVASRATLEALGRMFVTRVENKEENFKVWGLANGNVWLHTPGDSGR